MLKYLDSDRQLFLVCQLVHICKVPVPNDLILIMAKAIKDDCLAMLQTWIDNLNLHELATEFDRYRTMENLECACLREWLASFKDP